METGKSGGFLVGRKNGKIYVHNNGDLGGYLVGRRHSQGGIKGHNESTGQPIEVESGEIQVSSKAINSNKKQVFNGVPMTNREILSKLNVEGGGVAFESGGKVENEIEGNPDVVNAGAGQPITYKGGEVILTRGAVSSPKKYDFNGKKMTTREIASAMNVEAGGVAFNVGGELKQKDCGCNHMENGGEISDAELKKRYQEIQQLRLQKGIEKERRDHYETLSKLNAGTITINDALREIAEKEMKIDKNYPFVE